MKEIINYHLASVISKIMLWIGIVIIMSSLVYMIINLMHADSFITMWIFFMIIGVGFSFISVIIDIIIKLSQKKIFLS